jgi:four helix bundle protein
MSRDSILKRKSFVFAIRIINLYKYLKANRSGDELSRQVLRSGTAVGAIIREAEHAASTKDFVNKLTVSLKEINETIYWLELLVATDIITTKMFDSLNQEGIEILKMLIASIKTTKARVT